MGIFPRKSVRALSPPSSSLGREREIRRERGKRDRQTRDGETIGWEDDGEAAKRERPGELLNKLLNSHPAGFYFYLNGVAQIRTVILVQSPRFEFICTVR